MKKFIILTGISRVGKTTLSKYIQNRINNVTVINVDTIFEQICEIIGFNNEKEKNRNRTIALNCFRKMLQECMKRKDEIIVVDYPFQTLWKDFFSKVSNQYNYDVLTVKLYGDTFEDVYKRACIRDLSKDRNIIHESNYYNPNKKEKVHKRKVQSKEVLREIYENESRTNFTIGKELKLISKDEKTLEECFQQIKIWILENGK